MNREPAEPALSDYYIAASAGLAERKRWTLKHGDTFALLDDYGNVVPGGPEGIFHEDTRHLARSALSIEGLRPLLLSASMHSSDCVLSVDLTNPDLIRDGELLLAKDTFHIARALFLWDGTCHELISVRNFDRMERRVRFALAFDADFADLFEVRGFRRSSPRGEVIRRVTKEQSLRFEYSSLDDVRRSTEIFFSPAPARLSTQGAEYQFDLAPKARRLVSVRIRCESSIAPASRMLPFSLALRRARHWIARPESARIGTSNELVNSVLQRSLADTSMLLTNTPHGPYPYAGIPWFSTVFGRDGLIAAIEMLWFDPTIARGVLGVLAAHQAQGFDAAAAAEPGKILHELRHGELARIGEIPFGRYYGTVDATPLFVVLAGLYWQRTADRATLERIWPNIKAAIAWIERHGDRDGDGFVEYGDSGPHSGLLNQGWKDSDDAIFHADGTLARPPIALAEVQGYVYLAWRLGAGLAVAMGEADLAASLVERALHLRERFEQAFWCEDLGMYALALDGAKQPCRVRTSNGAQVLFSGIATPDRARRTAQEIFSREFYNGWGIRTVHESEARFNPASYHNGSVWPHDNALIALGLAGYGEHERVLQLTTSMFDAAHAIELRRLPELFCGFPRRRRRGPTAYPVACSPQAWAAAAPLALLQACLNFTFDVPNRLVRLHHPRLPHFIDTVHLRQLPVGDARLDLLLQRHGSEVAVNVLARHGKVDIAVIL